MSICNALLGMNKAAPVLLKILGIDHKAIPRLRDCYPSKGSIVIYTQTGGANREYYDNPNEEQPDGPSNKIMYQNEHYLRNEDDSFDSTYAYFYFGFPEEYREDLEALGNTNEEHTPSAKWQALVSSLTD
jgi:hypothetical protein